MNNKVKNYITEIKHKDGYFHFYWGSLDITSFWMDFFSNLSLEEEKECVKIFVSRYGKKFNAKLLHETNLPEHI